jgi:hypothetical protein
MTMPIWLPLDIKRWARVPVHCCSKWSNPIVIGQIPGLQIPVKHVRIIIGSCLTMPGAVHRTSTIWCLAFSV